jgi:DeoR family transcriptional regulator, fructose operon transcriptional repressor
MYAEERQQAIARLVTQRGRMSVNQLAREYDVTTETVRRDLSSLERMGLVRRVHGGVVPPGSVSLIESGIRERDQVNTEIKERIARAALAQLPAAGGTVLLDAGSTTVRLATLFPPDRELTVITHAVPIAARLAGLRHIQLRLLPGRVRRTTQAAVGAETVEALSHLRVDVSFVGTNGITAEHGLTTPDPDEAAVKHALIESGRQVVVLADASKFGIETAIRFASAADVEVIVTDGDAPAAERRALAKAGIEVVIA